MENNIEAITENIAEEANEEYAAHEGTDEAEQTEPTDVQSEESAEQTEDYERIISEDIEALKGEFAELADLKDITQLENPLRYAALRDMGLSAAEAYLATTRSRVRYDTRSHLMPGVRQSISSPSMSLSATELRTARELFDDMSDEEIQRLYRRVKYEK